jgi:hypothetical protein
VLIFDWHFCEFEQNKLHLNPLAFAKQFAGMSVSGRKINIRCRKIVCAQGRKITST